MKEKNTFQEKRFGNRKVYLKGRKLQEAKYLKHVQKIEEGCYALTSSIDNFLEKKVGVWDMPTIKFYMLKLDLLKEATMEDFSELIKEEVSQGFRRAEKKYLEGQGVDIERSYFHWKKKKERKKLESKIGRICVEYKVYLSDIQRNLVNVRNLSQNEEYEISEDNKSSFSNSIEELNRIFGEGTGTKTIEKEKIEELKQEFLKKSKEYRIALKAYRPKSDDERNEAAKANIKCLEEEIDFIKTNRRKHFDSLEGLIMGYCSYEFEARRIDEDEKYMEFLKIKSIEKLLKIKSHDMEKINSILGEFVKKGYIRDEEYNYVKSRIENEFKLREEPSIENVELRAEFISCYNVPYDKALEIAKQINDEDIDRMSSELPKNVGVEIANVLISDNPNIFLLDESDFKKYLTKAVDLVALTRKYSMIDDFNSIKSPQNFSSLEALRGTRKKLHDMIGIAAVNGSPQAEEKDEIDEIKFQLSKDGFEPDMTLAILQKGFFFNGEYFTGSHRLSDGSLERNTRRRYKGFDKRVFNRELSRLITAGAISYMRGYSINLETKSIESEALKNAIKYVLIPKAQEKTLRAEF